MTLPVAVAYQYLLPKTALTRLMGRAARAHGGALTTAAIRWFVRHYGVRMDEALVPDVGAYATFNEFFTRALKPGIRPMSRAPLVSPVDGAVSQCGGIRNDQIFQAKGHHYTTTQLLAGDAALASRFENGHFATIYLSPRDYHRIHMPCEGVLQQMVYVPGALFSVNPVTVGGVPGLFARNERVICLFQGAAGPFVMVLVGATIVGSMATVWHGVVNPPRHAVVRTWHYGSAASSETPTPSISLRQGDEMGRFLLGSTVVMLFPAGPLRFNSGWHPGCTVRLGEPMAT